MTQYRHLYHEHQHHHHHYHHHHHHHYNHKESIPATPLVPDKTFDTVDPKSTNPVEPKSTDQVNTSPLVETPDTAMANHTKCKREDDTEVSLQQNAIKDPKLRSNNTWKFACVMGFVSLDILGALLVSNYMALKILVIVEFTFFSMDSLITYLHYKFCTNYNGSPPASIYDAPKDIEEDEKALLCFFISLGVLNAALLIENPWILKLLAMFTPLSVLSVCLAIYLKPDFLR